MQAAGSDDSEPSGGRLFPIIAQKIWPRISRMNTN
jgi:hypothetical protein